MLHSRHAWGRVLAWGGEVRGLGALCVLFCRWHRELGRAYLTQGQAMCGFGELAASSGFAHKPCFRQLQCQLALDISAVGLVTRRCWCLMCAFRVGSVVEAEAVGALRGPDVDHVHVYPYASLSSLHRHVRRTFRSANFLCYLLFGASRGARNRSNQKACHRVAHQLCGMSAVVPTSCGGLEGAHAWHRLSGVCIGGIRGKRMAHRSAYDSVAPSSPRSASLLCWGAAG